MSVLSTNGIVVGYVILYLSKLLWRSYTIYLVLPNLFSKITKFLQNLFSTALKKPKENNVKAIIEAIKSRGITPYSIGKHTPLNEMSVGNILKGRVKKPNDSTLQILQKFIRDYDAGLIGKEIEEDFPIFRDPVLEAIERLSNIIVRNDELLSEGIKQTLLNTEKLKMKSDDIIEFQTTAMESLESLLKDIR